MNYKNILGELTMLKELDELSVGQELYIEAEKSYSIV